KGSALKSCLVSAAISPNGCAKAKTAQITHPIAWTYNYPRDPYSGLPITASSAGTACDDGTESCPENCATPLMVIIPKAIPTTTEQRTGPKVRVKCSTIP